MSMMTITDDDYEPDEDCTKCDERARRYTCDDCGVTGMFTNCGHFPQPRPIAADGNRTYCEECYAKRQGTTWEHRCDECGELVAECCQAHPKAMVISGPQSNLQP